MKKITRTNAILLTLLVIALLLSTYFGKEVLKNRQVDALTNNPESKKTENSSTNEHSHDEHDHEGHSHEKEASTDNDNIDPSPEKINEITKKASEYLKELGYNNEKDLDISKIQINAEKEWKIIYKNGREVVFNEKENKFLPQ